MLKQSVKGDTSTFMLLWMLIMCPLLCTDCRYYDDFHTIDWVRDRNRDRLRHQRLNKNRKLSWKGWAKKFWDAGSGWLIVFLVGVSSGILAGTNVHSPCTGGVMCLI